ncbi:MAG: hypothetical protein HQM07_04880 [Zetaproteobacteria bacterium]|nr:hypothetical protein [Zetaproteobacteria bacterium]
MAAAGTVVYGRAGLKSKLMACMSYLGVLCLVPLLMNRDDSFVNFHARQGLVLWIWSVLAFFSLHLPGLGKWFCSMSLLMVFAFSMIGLVSVLLRKAWKLPLIHSLAVKL